MAQTIGYHWVKSGYGLWLPGDERGHWSEAWDEQIGFCEPHALHDGDPVRLRMAEERMKHRPVRLDAGMIEAVVSAIRDCANESKWTIAAFAIEETHMHALLTYTTSPIDNTLKWLAQETTKAVHRQTAHAGPVWCKGRWRQFIFDPAHWQNTIHYIERHNTRRGLAPRPYDFIIPQ